MSKYNDYAARLDAEFKAATLKTNEAIEAYQKAEKNRSTRYTGEADFQKASDDLKKVQREVWPNFQKTRDRLGRELAAEVEKDQKLNPDELDMNAVTLINSGLAKAGDLESMAEKYSDNITMRRIIGATAREMADKEDDPTTRHKLTMLSHNANARPAVLESWDNLVGVSKHYSDEYSRNADASYIARLAKHWEADNVQAAIKDF